MLVGGVTGLVPLMRLLTNIKPSNEPTVLIGAKTQTEVLFEDLSNKLLEKNKHKVIVVTEDGTYGKKDMLQILWKIFATKQNLMQCIHVVLN